MAARTDRYDASSNSGRLYSPTRLVAPAPAPRGASLRRERRDQIGEPRASAPARTPSRRSRRAQVDALQALRRRRAGSSRASSVCAGSVRSRVAIWKSSKRSLMPIVLRGVALARQVAGELLAQLGEDRAELGAVAHRVQVALEGRLAADRLRLARTVTTGRSSRPCAASCSQAPKLLPKCATRKAGSAAARSPIVCDAERRELRRRLRADAVDLARRRAARCAPGCRRGRAASGRRACRARRRSSTAACSA